MRRSSVFGSAGLLFACLAPIAAVVTCMTTCHRVGGDIGGIAGFVTGLCVLAGVWALGLLSGILGLVWDRRRAKAIVALVISLAGEGVVVLLIISGG